MLTYRELLPDEFRLAPREVPGSEGYTPENSRILAAINEKGEVVSTWTMFMIVHLEPFWVREDYRKSMTIMRRMTEHMKALMKDLGIQACYTVVLFNTPVLARFAKWFGARKIDGDLYYWTDPSAKI
jgi:hypothetical protein